MSDFAPWEMGVHLPPDIARAQDGRRVRIVPNPAVPIPAVISTPLLAVETEVWVKPSAAACFPLHPLGVMSLYQRARKLLTDTGLVGSLSPEQLTNAEVCVWKVAGKLYKPGCSIRARLDAMVEERGFYVTEKDKHDPFVAQPAHLAAWVVQRAALAWAQEATP